MKPLKFSLDLFHYCLLTRNCSVCGESYIPLRPFHKNPIEKINMLFASLRWSILAKSVSLFSSMALDLRPHAILETSRTVFPSTDLTGEKGRRFFL